MRRFRIGLLEDVTAKEVSHFHRSPLILCKKKSDLKKYGRAFVGSMEEELGVFLLQIISSKIVYGSNTEKIINHLNESLWGFNIVVLNKEMSASDKKAFDSLPKDRVKVVIMGNESEILDIGDGKFFNVHKDFDAPLYESTAPIMRPVSTSSVAPKVTPVAKSKAKANKSAEISAAKLPKKSE